ncbi:MAG: hypothetical protein ISS72_03445 [Candidatus Brocadiae bacterium]|nr:hypothetical protein [Candidatus Brocadiia bacterium]
MLSTSSAFIDPAQQDKQTLSVRYSWLAPPVALVPGKQVTMSFHATIETNSHPNRGQGWGGGGWLALTNRRGGNIDGIPLADKNGRTGVSFGNYARPSSTEQVYGSTGKVTFTGSATIPDSKAGRQEGKQTLLDLGVLMNWGNQWRSYHYVYAWKGGAPPAQPPSPPVVEPGTGQNIVGVWQHEATGETWTFTPLGGGRYAAVEKGGIARGTAVVTGNKMTMDIVSNDGKATAKYEAIFAAGGRSANVTVRYSTGQTGTSTWVRGGGPATVVPPDPPSPPEPGTIPGPTAVAGMTLRAEARKAKTGETATVPISLLKGAGLIDLNFNLEYDPSVVQAVGNVVKGNLLAGAEFEANTAKRGVVQVGLVPKTGGISSANGTLAQVAFKAIGRAGSRTTLRLVVRKASAAGGAPAKIATIDGEVQITDEGGFLPGDVNGDGKVSMDDVLMALKISVELLPHNARADVDKDGQVTAADARLIRNRVLGIKG